MDRYPGRSGSNIGLANAPGDIKAVQQDAVALKLGLKRNGCFSGKREQRGLFVKGEIVFNGLERKRAVHGPGLEIEEAEATGQMRGKRALARTGRSVDGDDRTALRR